MKKSVVLPYERYQQLLQNKTVPEVGAENSQSGPEPSQASVLESPKLNTSVIIACLPKRNRSKAQQLLEYIEKHPKLDWNNQGNLLVDSNLVEYSHIVDLLHDALNPTKHEPVGREVFYKQLEHVPRSLINNPKRKSLTGGGDLPPPGLPATEPKSLNIWKSRWKSL